MENAYEINPHVLTLTCLQYSRLIFWKPVFVFLAKGNKKLTGIANKIFAKKISGSADELISASRRKRNKGNDLCLS